jgi:RNA polymerase sigma factor (TIGR02999 family)
MLVIVTNSLHKQDLQQPALCAILLFVMGQELSVEGMVTPVRSRTTEELVSELYDELRKIAAQRMAHERAGDTLQATALVNEAWMRLCEERRQDWQDERQLIAAASEVMRRILVDRARKKQSQRQGGGWRRTELEADGLPMSSDRPETTLLVDELLELLGRSHPDKVAVVELRFYAGLNFREIASLLDTSERSVRRSWQFAKAWLATEAEVRR